MVGNNGITRQLRPLSVAFLDSESFVDRVPNPRRATVGLSHRLVFHGDDLSLLHCLLRLHGALGGTLTGTDPRLQRTDAGAGLPNRLPGRRRAGAWNHVGAGPEMWRRKRCGRGSLSEREPAGSIPAAQHFSR